LPLQSAYDDDEIGSFENLKQLIEDAPLVLLGQG
jgi:hypothetical protein